MDGERIVTTIYTQIIFSNFACVLDLVDYGDRCDTLINNNAAILSYFSPSFDFSEFLFQKTLIINQNFCTFVKKYFYMNRIEIVQDEILRFTCKKMVDKCLEIKFTFKIYKL